MNNPSSPNWTFHVVDLETTGDQPDDQIIEYGVTELIVGSQQRPHTFCGLVKPTKLISIEAMAVHHITEAMLSIYGDFATEYAQAQRWFGPAPVIARVAHNAKFEETYWPIKDNIPWICTMKCAMRLLPECKKYGNQYLRYFLDLNFSEYDMNWINMAHRAGPDSVVTAKIFNYLLSLAGMDYGKMIAWSKDIPRPRYVGFGMHKGALWVNLPHSYLYWIAAKSDFDDETKQYAREVMNGQWTEDMR